MEILSGVTLSDAGALGLVMMFMVIIYWVRSPERIADRETRD